MDNGLILGKFRENMQKYAGDFSSGEMWEKLKKYASKLGLQTVYKALQMYYLVLDPTVSVADKAIITAALGYLILPIDIVPDILPGGLLDDGVILAWALRQVEGVMTESARAQARKKLSDWFSPEAVARLD